MAQHVEETARWINLETDDVTAWSNPRPDYPVPTARLTPRVDLYCDPGLFEAWGEYVWQLEVFAEECRMAGPQVQWAETDPTVAKLRKKIEAVRKRLKIAVADDDD